VLKDIADEERVHAGEFLRLLKELTPIEKRFYGVGTEVVEVEIEKLKKKVYEKIKCGILHLIRRVPHFSFIHLYPLPH